MIVPTKEYKKLLGNEFEKMAFKNNLTSLPN